MFVIILSVVLYASNAAAQTAYKDLCPHVEGVENFDLNAFASVPWYEIARYPNHWEKRGDCSKLDFKKDDKGIEFIITNVIDNKLNEIDGYIDYHPKANNSGILVFKSKSFEESEGKPVVPVYILYVSYDKFTVAYDCYYDEATKNLQEYVWISSRTKDLDDETRELANNFIKSSKIIDEKKLVWDHFTDEICNIIS